MNIVLGALGLPLPGWLADASTARFPFVVMSLFQFGGLRRPARGPPRNPGDYYDAGAVDGAGRLSAFR